MDILLNGFHKLHVLFGRVGVVHAEIAQSAVLFGGAKVDDQGLAVADVQIAVGFRREPGVDGLTGVAAALGDVFVDKGMDEVFAFSNFSHRNASSLRYNFSNTGHYKPFRLVLQQKILREAEKNEGKALSHSLGKAFPSGEGGPVRTLGRMRWFLVRNRFFRFITSPALASLGHPPQRGGLCPSLTEQNMKKQKTF